MQRSRWKGKTPKRCPLITCGPRALSSDIPRRCRSRAAPHWRCNATPVMGLVKNRVLAVLVLAGLAAALGLPFLTHAPNRLISGTGISLAQLVSDMAGRPLAWLALLPALLLVAAIFMRPAGSTQIVIYLAATLLLTGLARLAADHATQLAGQSGAIARTSLGGALWLLGAL